MHIGYARVSTKDQNLALQEDALKSVGCEKVFRGIASGSNWDGSRPLWRFREFGPARAKAS